MARTKGIKKKKQLGTKKQSLRLSDAVEKIRILDATLRGLINYVEYVAAGLDLSVSYSELLAKQISRGKHTHLLGGVAFSSIENIPTFEEFKKMEDKKRRADIPF